MLTIFFTRHVRRRAALKTRRVKHAEKQLSRNDAIGGTLDAGEEEISKAKDPNAKEITKSQWLKTLHRLFWSIFMDHLWALAVWRS
jgi:hypothetical protein